MRFTNGGRTYRGMDKNRFTTAAWGTTQTDRHNARMALLASRWACDDAEQDAIREEAVYLVRTLMFDLLDAGMTPPLTLTHVIAHLRRSSR